MQTFMPHMFFSDVAKCLDNRRLNKQKVECKQIFLALTDPNYGWQNHPAVLMWKGFEFALLDYALYIAEECIKRGMKDTLKPFFHDAARDYNFKQFGAPAWVYDERLISSHRANLLRKDPVHYGKFGWKEQPAMHYFWPTHHKEYREFLEEPRIQKVESKHKVIWQDFSGVRERIDPEHNNNGVFWVEFPIGPEGERI